MKNLWIICFTLFTVSAFLGCKKDDDMEPEFKSEFTYDGMTYALDNGYFNNLGSVGGGNYDWDIILSSSEVTIDASNRLTGTGEYIYLDLNASSVDDLVAGTYTWANSREAFTIVPGSEVTVDYNTDLFQGTRLSLSGGTVSIAIDGEEYTIEFDLTASGGKTIKGQYKGMLEDY